MDFTSRQLEQFLVLVEEMHFGRAAERLTMSQPPLSQAMQRLERGLGVELFDRSERGIRLTKAGEVFAEDARRMLDSQAGAVERARRVAKGLEGSLRVGYVPSLAYWFTPKLVAVAAEEDPGLRVELRQRPFAHMMEEVRGGVTDVAFARSKPADLEGLEVKYCLEERVEVGVSLRHRLAGAASVRLEELADEEFVLPSQHVLAELHNQVVAACQRAGFVPKARVYADDLPGMVSYVAAGIGIGLVPEQMASMRDGLMSVIRLEEGCGLTGLGVFATHRIGADAAVIRLLDILRRRRDEFERSHESGM